MKCLMIFITVMALVGCKPGEKEALKIAKVAISSELKDPEGVEFKFARTTEIHDESDGAVIATVCGQVNGKNSFGAYVGFKKFIVMLAMKKDGTNEIITKNILNSELDESVFNYQEECGKDV